MSLKPIIYPLLVILLAGSITACGLFTDQETPTPIPDVNVTPQPEVVSAEAFVVPVREADLAFEVGGQVTSLKVEEGEEVKEGQILAELDNSTQKVGVAQAEAGLAEAKAQLAEVRAGPTPAEIAQAEADITRAEAALAELLAGPTAEAIVEAEANVRIAQANLDKVLAGSRDEDIEAAATRLLQAEAEVRLKQADYDKNVFGDPQVAEPFGVALEKAKQEYQAAKAEYDKLVNGATAEEIAVARAEVNKALALLNQVRAGATAEQIAQAQAAVIQAEAALAELNAGATSEEIAVAEAGVQAAEASLRVAQTELAKTQLIAPFAGRVSALNVNQDERVEAGAPLISLGDTSRWQIETDDLTEIDVVNVQEGAKVSISVDALPGEEFEGRVVRVTPKSETKAGDVTYTVLIDITSGNTSRLRWGMTTFVDIEVGPGI